MHVHVVTILEIGLEGKRNLLIGNCARHNPQAHVRDMSRECRTHAGVNITSDQSLSDTDDRLYRYTMNNMRYVYMHAYPKKL